VGLWDLVDTSASDRSQGMELLRQLIDIITGS
jgi:hypothetical protein